MNNKRKKKNKKESKNLRWSRVWDKRSCPNNIFIILGILLLYIKKKIIFILHWLDSGEESSSHHHHHLFFGSGGSQNRRGAPGAPRAKKIKHILGLIFCSVPLGSPGFHGHSQTKKNWNKSEKSKRSENAASGGLRKERSALSWNRSVIQTWIAAGPAERCSFSQSTI